MDDPVFELEAALELEDETERKLAVAALINELVAELGFRAIVIGGVAVEFWTHGAFATGDIDLYLPSCTSLQGSSCTGRRLRSCDGRSSSANGSSRAVPTVPVSRK